MQVFDLGAPGKVGLRLRPRDAGEGLAPSLDHAGGGQRAAAPDLKVCRLGCRRDAGAAVVGECWRKREVSASLDLRTARRRTPRQEGVTEEGRRCREIRDRREAGMRSRLGAPMVPVAGGVLLDKEDAGERRTAAVEDAGATGKSRPTRMWVALDRILMWVDSGVGEVLGAGDEELLEAAVGAAVAAAVAGMAAAEAGICCRSWNRRCRSWKRLQKLESPLQKLEAAAEAGIVVAEAGMGTAGCWKLLQLAGRALQLAGSALQLAGMGCSSWNHCRGSWYGAAVAGMGCSLLEGSSPSPCYIPWAESIGRGLVEPVL
ncbi:hypothetical protein MLD38_031182 [Melastoma candidum]|uniref:Uncharacterized protein n=1 Tax=Melastoma candidum TaxID=119954 RepID=A0ACB9MQV0_9MYRT|nr:hypothetical protein MLD38_031182 [Melastoma candidum]